MFFCYKCCFVFFFKKIKEGVFVQNVWDVIEVFFDKYIVINYDGIIQGIIMFQGIGIQ